ncbi:MAG: phytanoyl-CoA dioxygenase family protein, partial [Chloroflexota bacterium]
MANFRIDEATVQQYHTDGYILFDQPLFAPEKFARLAAIFEEMAAGVGEGKRTDELDKPHFNDPRLFEFLMADEVLDIVEPLIGPNIGLWSSHFIAKEPFVG